jgi:hypothetical protein
MADWFSYSLTDFLLFAPETYQRLFVRYNQAVWPAQIVGALGALVVLWLVLWLVLRRVDSRIAIGVVHALPAIGWLWIGTDFLYQRYGVINWAATWPAVGFMAQGVLLLAVAAIAPRPAGHAPPAARIIGLGLMAAALVVVPLSGPLAGRPWGAIEIVGVTPDPTAVFTLGLLAGTAGIWRLILLPVPVLWCLFSGATALAMDTGDAWLLPVLAAAGLVAALLPRPAPAGRG